MKRSVSGKAAEKDGVRHRVNAVLRHVVPGIVDTLEADEDVVDTPFEEGVHDKLDPDLRHRMISEAAYHLYAQRGYIDGYHLDDWLQAEAQIDHVSLRPGREQNANTPRAMRKSR